MRILLIRPMPSKKAVSIKNFMFGEPILAENLIMDDDEDEDDK